MRKQAILFILLVLILFIFNKIFMSELAKTTTLIDMQELVNKEQVSPDTLFDRSWTIIKNNYFDQSLNGQKWDRWQKHYEGKIKTDEDAAVAVNTMLSSLDDPYSKYLNKKEYADQNTSIDSKITGIGVNIASESGKIVIVSVIEGTPAANAKLQAKDIIIAIDDKDVKGMNIGDVATLVRGAEKSFVNVTVLRKKQKITKRIQRTEIKIKTVKSSVDKNIGYIQITTFIGSRTPLEFIEALEKTQNTDGLILDLRGNTGGLLPNAIFIANMFITKGNIVSIVGRNGYKKDFYAQSTEYGIKKPLLVLIDGGSASASEILSGALKDYHRAKLIGTKTFGKGMVQKIIPMPNSTGLNLTIAKYLTPAGHDINKKGINPDIEVTFTTKDYITKRDVQLEKAKSVMTDMIKKQK